MEQLKTVDSLPEAHDGPQMILAGQLNDLLDIFPLAQILFIDLRSPSEFQRSHIHSAVNLRIPSRFLRKTSLDLLDRTFPDEQSRRSFTRWSKTKCMVIYDRNIEAPWECPIAPDLLDVLRTQGWPGRCFVLKGPFREFSMSFDKYITGDRMTKDSKKYTDGLRSATPPTEEQLRRNQARYEEWLRRVQHEGSLQTNYSKPREVTSKKAAIDDHQRELEAEFKGRFPDLYRRMKAMGAQQPSPSHHPPAPPPKHGKQAFYDDDSYFDTRKAHLVGSLSTGLDKMRDASTPGSANSTPHDRVPDKLGELPSLDFEDFDEIDPREAQSPPYRPGPGGRSAASSTASGETAGAAPVSPLDHAARRVAREALGKQGLWKRLRSNNGK